MSSTRCPICNQILCISEIGVHSHLRTHKLPHGEFIDTLRSIVGGGKERYRSIKARIRKGELVSREDFLIVKGRDQKLNAGPAVPGKDFRAFRDNVESGYFSGKHRK